MAVEVTRRRFTVDEYEAMGAAGILGEDDRVELIDGEILTMSPPGPPHYGTVNRLTHLFVRLAGETAVVHVQSPVRVDRYSEPQPDLALLRPRADYYAGARVTPVDVLLAIEVADTSLAFDRTVKAALYARRGIVEYWIVDVHSRAVIRHADPRDGRYTTVDVVPPDTPFAPRLLPACVVTMADLLG